MMWEHGTQKAIQRGSLGSSMASLIQTLFQ